MITRKEAKEKGLKFYFTGKPCRHGHVEKRQVSNGCCYTCSLLKAKNYAKKNPDKRRERKAKNIELYRATARAYVQKNFEKLKKQREEKKQHTRERERKYNVKNADRIKAKKLEWYSKNKEKVKLYGKKRYELIKNDRDFRLKKVMRMMVQRVLKGKYKKSRTVEMLGYNHQDLINHIESTWQDGMSWENYGEWHIDHVKPISWFFKNDILDVKMINALENLQALWAKDNLSKGDRFEETV